MPPIPDSDRRVTRNLLKNHQVQTQAVHTSSHNTRASSKTQSHSSPIIQIKERKTGRKRGLNTNPIETPTESTEDAGEFDKQTRPKQKKQKTKALASQRADHESTLPIGETPDNDRSARQKAKDAAGIALINQQAAHEIELPIRETLDDQGEDDNLNHEENMPSVEVDDPLHGGTRNRDNIILELTRKVMSLEKELAANGNDNDSQRRTLTSESVDVLQVHRGKRRKKAQVGPDAMGLRNLMNSAANVTSTSSQSPVQMPSDTPRSSNHAASASVSALDNSGHLSQPSRQEGSLHGDVAEKPAHQLRAYTGRVQRVLQQAKQYLHYYLISQEAFPDQGQTAQFISRAFDRAMKDYHLDLCLTEAQAKLLRSHVSRVRNRWKEAARTAMRSYDITGPPTMKQERVEYLLGKYRYLYEKIKIKSDGTEQRTHPFAHPAISAVIEAAAFTSKEGPARLFNGCLKPIPLATLAFAAVAIMNALSEYQKAGIATTLPFDATTYGPKYTSLRNHAICYSTSKLEACQALQLDLYKSGMFAIGKIKSAGLSDEDDFTVGETGSDESIDDDAPSDGEIDTDARVLGRSVASNLNFRGNYSRRSSAESLKGSDSDADDLGESGSDSEG